MSKDIIASMPKDNTVVPIIENPSQTPKNLLINERITYRKEAESKKSMKTESNNLTATITKKISTGRWTKGENAKFIEALKKYGHNWKKVEFYVGTRTGTQIRSHAQKHFLKMGKTLAENNSDSVTQSIHLIKDQDHSVPEKNTPEASNPLIVEIFSEEAKKTAKVESLEELNKQTLHRLNDFIKKIGRAHV